MNRQRIIQSFFAAAVVLTAPFAISIIALGGLAVLAGLRALPVAVPLPWVVFFDVPHFAVALLFSDLTRYVVVSLLALLLLAGGLVRLAIRSGRRLVLMPQFYLLVLGIACVLGFAALDQHEPAVRPAPNVQMQVVQAPNFLMGIVHRSQVSAEVPGCAYEVLGWADAVTLAYRQWCGGFFDPNNHYVWKEGTPEPARVYRVDNQTDLPYAGDPARLARKTCAYLNCVRPLLGEDYVHTFSSSPRHSAVPDDCVLSPDGRWVAFRAMHTFYGPEDLVILEHLAATATASFSIYLCDRDDRPLISLADIVAYSSQTHAIRLTADGYARVAQLRVPTTGIPFQVSVNGETIYSGAFWALYSSLSYDGVVIKVPLMPNPADGSDHAMSITLGYPGGDFFRGPDPRSDPRIFKALQQAGKLE